ncbi:MAG: Fe-S cluster assembly ATPase SufC [Candidatus Magasanikbacteria bacterium]|nr:Fe-S cluster assembly ATPase SufC [Candidatus Magasanikbacteria bacterium]
MSLELKNLHINVEKKEIVRGLSLIVLPGEVHVIMGPNGSGKSTFANTLLGHPKYTITKGMIELNKLNITKLPPEERAKHGLFLAMQHTPEIPGVSVANFLRLAIAARTGERKNPIAFRKDLLEMLAKVGLAPDFAARSLNAGFSGGERKRLEMLQLLTFEPAYSILDETDSGLDVDALKIVVATIQTLKKRGKGFLVITHYPRLLSHLKVDTVHIMAQGKIVKTGGAELAAEIEKEGFKKYEE